MLGFGLESDWFPLLLCIGDTVTADGATEGTDGQRKSTKNHDDNLNECNLIS